MQRENTLKQTGETPVMRQAGSILWETVPPGGTFTVSKEEKEELITQRGWISHYLLQVWPWLAICIFICRRAFSQSKTHMFPLSLSLPQKLHSFPFFFFYLILIFSAFIFVFVVFHRERESDYHIWVSCNLPHRGEEATPMFVATLKPQ